MTITKQQQQVLDRLREDPSESIHIPVTDSLWQVCMQLVRKHVLWYEIQADNTFTFVLDC